MDSGNGKKNAAPELDADDENFPYYFTAQIRPDTLDDLFYPDRPTDVSYYYIWNRKVRDEEGRSWSERCGVNDLTVVGDSAISEIITIEYAPLLMTCKFDATDDPETF